MKLFHYTCLMHLPSILRGGLSKGEIPISDTKTAYGPNFTGSVNPTQHWSEGGVTDKTKVRITVELEAGDPKLKQWLKLWVGSKEHLRAWNSFGQGKFWWVYVDGVVSPDKFRAVELKGDNGYQIIEGQDLSELVERIENERKRLVFTQEPHPHVPGQVMDYVSLREGESQSWLLDGKL